METKSLRGADIVARSLERLGCRHVFTLSGNHIMSVFDAALETRLDLVHVRHEAAAVHMADAWGRLTGEAGIAMVTGGPGSRQRGRRTVHRARRGIPDGAAVGSRRDLGARPRRLPGNPPGRHGGAGQQGVVHRDLRRDARARHRRGDAHRDLGPSRAGASEPAVGSAGGDGREQRDRVARRPARIGSVACGVGRRRGARRDRIRGAAGHLRGSATVQCERARAARPAGSRRRKRRRSFWKARAASRTRRSARSPTSCNAPT